MALALEPGSEQYAPLARAILGGLTVSGIVTVFLVPSAYLLIHRNQAHEPKQATASSEVSHSYDPLHLALRMCRHCKLSSPPQSCPTPHEPRIAFQHRPSPPSTQQVPSAPAPTAGPALTRQQAEQLALKNNPRTSVSTLLAMAQQQVVRETRSAPTPPSRANSPRRARKKAAASPPAPRAFPPPQPRRRRRSA